MGLLLLAGRLVFLALLYLFIFLVIRSTTRDIRSRAVHAAAMAAPAPWESARVEAGRPAETEGWALVVERSPHVREGSAFSVPAGAAMVAGRGGDTDIHLPDTFASARHARFEGRDDGLLIEDMASTNGTFVNGHEIERPTLAVAGDLVAVGDTVFRVEAGLGPRRQ